MAVRHSRRFQKHDEFVAYFWSMSDRSNLSGCWPWMGALKWKGYGYIYCGRKWHSSKRTNVIAYEIANKTKVLPNLTIDHLCRNTSCVNPSHLEMVTNRENTIRGISFAAVNAKKTHCERGHAFTEANTRYYKGGRTCRACHAIRLADGRRRASAKRLGVPISEICCHGRVRSECSQCVRALAAAQEAVKEQS